MSNYFVIEGTTLNKYTGGETDVVIPNGVTKIGEHAFEGCKSIKSVVIPEGVKEILGGDQYHTGNYGAFYGCENLESIALPESLKKIGMHVFQGCKNLKTVNLPAGLKWISRQLFSGCASLESITIPEGVTRIDEGAFEGCESLKDVNIPDSVRDMGWKVFDGCESLEKIDLPKNLTDIGYGHFWDGAAFKDCISLKHIDLPEGLDEIIPGMFEGCINLESVKIPESATKIGVSAFEGCENLEDIVLPQNVIEIGEDAFKGCTKIKNINLPEGIEKVGAEIFEEDEEAAGNVEGPYNTKPEWLSSTKRGLHGSIAKLIELKWLDQMTPEDWANLYLTQDAQHFKLIFANLMTDSPDVYLAVMTDILKKRGTPEMFFNAANYAQTHNTELGRDIIEALLKETKSAEGAEAVAELVESVLNDEPDPYAFIREYWTILIKSDRHIYGSLKVETRYGENRQNIILIK